MKSTLPATTEIILSDLQPNQRATVQSVSAHEQDARRLAGFAVCGGREVTMIKTGDPLILQVYGSRVALSERLARQVSVVPVGV